MARQKNNHAAGPCPAKFLALIAEHNGAWERGRKDATDRLGELTTFSSPWRIRHGFAIPVRSSPSHLRTYSTLANQILIMLADLPPLCHENENSAT
jgi:hypothetical protein